MASRNNYQIFHRKLEGDGNRIRLYEKKKKESQGEYLYGSQLAKCQCNWVDAGNLNFKCVHYTFIPNILC